MRGVFWRKRGTVVSIDFQLCDACGACIAVCPANALCLADRLTADAKRCTDCGICVRVCPFGALSPDVDKAEERLP